MRIFCTTVRTSVLPNGGGGCTHKVHADGGDVALGVGVIGKSEQQTRLSNTRISDKEELEEIVVSGRGHQPSASRQRPGKRLASAPRARLYSRMLVSTQVDGGAGGGKAATGAGTYHSGVTMVAAGFCLEGGVSGSWLAVERAKLRGGGGRGAGRRKQAGGASTTCFLRLKEGGRAGPGDGATH